MLGLNGYIVCIYTSIYLYMIHAQQLLTIYATSASKFCPSARTAMLERCHRSHAIAYGAELVLLRTFVTAAPATNTGRPTTIGLAL